MTTKPKILVLDVETAPGVAYVWSLWDKFVPIDRLIEPGRIISASWKWIGVKGVGFVSEWGVGRQQMLETMHALLSEADAVVTFNGDKFDLPRMNGEFIEFNLDPLPPLTSIDLRKTVKKLGLMSGKLDYALQHYGIGKKVETGGFQLWKDVLAGDPVAQDRMEQYNKHDVRMTAKLYLFLRPYMTNHPFLYLNKSVAICPNCGSKHIQHRGSRRTRTEMVEKIQCMDCGAWPPGKRTKIK